MSTAATTPIPAEEVAGGRPCSKISYSSAYSAFKRLNKINASGTIKYPLTQLYPCRDCDYYHLTSQPREQTRRLMGNVPIEIMASDPKISESAMFQIAFVGTVSEKVILAQNPALTAPLIFIFADPASPVAVRKALAHRPDLSLNTQKVLAKDIRSVRTSLAYNPHASQSVLISLAATDPELNEVVRSNPAIAQELVPTLPTVKPVIISSALPIHDDTKLQEPQGSVYPMDITAYIMKKHQKAMGEAYLFRFIVFLAARGWDSEEGRILINTEYLLKFLGIQRSTLMVYLSKIRKTGLWTVKQTTTSKGKEAFMFTPLFLDKIKK